MEMMEGWMDGWNHGWMMKLPVSRRLFDRWWSYATAMWLETKLTMENEKKNDSMRRKQISSDFFLFLIYVGCLGQLTRTTTIPHGPLDILQAQEQVRHRGGDRRAHRGSNPGRGRNKSHNLPQQLDPQVQIRSVLITAYFVNWLWQTTCLSTILVLLLLGGICLWFVNHSRLQSQERHVK
jgi:hypothetical protein